MFESPARNKTKEDQNHIEMKIATTAETAERVGFTFHSQITIIGLHFARNNTQLANSITRTKRKLLTLHNNLEDDLPKLKTKYFKFIIPSRLLKNPWLIISPLC